MALDALSGLTAGFGLVGTGISLFAGLQEAKIAGQEAGVEKDILQQDMIINNMRRQQAHLEAHRGQMQDIRSAQLARSMAVTSATAQGAQFGSGLQGGLAEISGKTNTNQLARSQNLTIADSIFSAYNSIDMSKMQLADLGGQMANYQGLGAIGGAVSGSASSLGKIGASLFG